jgi:hypothetical protein
MWAIFKAWVIVRQGVSASCTTMWLRRLSPVLWLT